MGDMKWVNIVKYWKNWISSNSTIFAYHFIQILRTENLISNTVKHELRVSSFELQIEKLKIRVEIQKCEFRSTAYEFEFTSYEFKFMKYKFKSTSYELRVQIHKLLVQIHELEVQIYEFKNNLISENSIKTFKFPHFLRS